MREEKYQKISVVSLALAIGIVWGLGTLIAAWCSMSGWGAPYVHMMGSMYMGYSSTFWGGIIGGIWGFIDGFIGGLLIGFFYNFFARRK